MAPFNFCSSQFRMQGCLISQQCFVVTVSVLTLGLLCNFMYQDSVIEYAEDTIGQFTSRTADLISQWASKSQDTVWRVGHSPCVGGRLLPTDENEHRRSCLNLSSSCDASYIGQSWDHFYASSAVPEMLLHRVFSSLILSFADKSVLGILAVTLPTECLVQYHGSYANKMQEEWISHQHILSYPDGVLLTDTNIVNVTHRSDFFKVSGKFFSQWSEVGVDLKGAVSLTLIGVLKNASQIIGRVGVTLNLQGLSALLESFERAQGSRLFLTSGNTIIGASNLGDRNPAYPTPKLVPLGYTLSPEDIAQGCSIVKEEVFRYKVCPYSISTFGYQPLHDIYVQMPDLFDPYNPSLGRESLTTKIAISSSNGLWRPSKSTVRTIKSGGIPYIIGSVPITVPGTANTDWILTVVAPQKQVTDEFTTIRTKIILITAALVVVAGAVAGLATHIVFGSLANTAKLMKAAKYLRLPETAEADTTANCDNAEVPEISISKDELKVLESKLRDRTLSRWSEISDIQIEYWNTQDELRRLKERIGAHDNKYDTHRVQYIHESTPITATGGQLSTVASQSKIWPVERFTEVILPGSQDIDAQ